ncbi:hypothetical protein ACTFIV_007736 [Dictyostelium citrinum]
MKIHLTFSYITLSSNSYWLFSKYPSPTLKSGANYVSAASCGFSTGKQYQLLGCKSGDYVIYAQDSINWEVGQQDGMDKQNEIMTITIQGKVLQFTKPLIYYHYGDQEELYLDVMVKNKLILNHFVVKVLHHNNSNCYLGSVYRFQDITIDNHVLQRDVVKFARTPNI